MNLRMCMAVLVCARGAVTADVIERRGAEPHLEGQITTIDDAGVAIRTLSGAVLVVSCPCAIGLAFPLADEMATVGLRRRGVPHVYQLFPGEGHGWRRAETIEAYYKAIEAFLRQYVIFA